MTMKMLVFFCCVAFTLVSQRAVAQRPAATEEWREHLLRGERLYNLGKFEEAIKEFEAGYELQPRAAFLLNLGQCYRQLERYEKAIWYYDRFLARAAAPPHVKEDVARIISKLRTTLEKREKTMPPIGPLRDEEGQRPRLDPPAKDGEKARPPSAKDIEVTRPPPLGGASWYDDVVGWGLAGGGLLMGGGAVWLLVSATDLEQQASAPQDETRAQELRDRATTRRIFGGVTALGGGALLVGGVVRLILHPNDGRPSPSSWRLDIAPNGIVVAGRF